MLWQHANYLPSSKIRLDPVCFRGSSFLVPKQTGLCTTAICQNVSYVCFKCKRVNANFPVCSALSGRSTMIYQTAQNKQENCGRKTYNLKIKHSNAQYSASMPPCSAPPSAWPWARPSPVIRFVSGARWTREGVLGRLACGRVTGRGGIFFIGPWAGHELNFS